MIRSYESTLGRLLVAKRGYDGMSTGMIKNDSRQVLPCDVFVAISGAVADQCRNNTMNLLAITFCNHFFKFIY